MTAIIDYNILDTQYTVEIHLSEVESLSNTKLVLVDGRTYNILPWSFIHLMEKLLSN